ncbi:bifunctional serine/threonine-protein kinase/formylglycine-generating enzyme family protein [Microcoleus sp. bin38.metabat.b11b12b14.051]|uniref:bifunctional serine/threonine-protein kinase/formylglycine-generating enzyme family protein n=1 Tax=Microcoleus sp. bin38.metabat.b11b12b14.051 TaxID=2742709 RepID=UPI0025DC038E|nr:bifunctional serine/threonine-protein kinase/formylglycine-generating enzyme family protein [Microcoleus sp. bin38.metabat.b11b12b14.051]
MPSRILRNRYQIIEYLSGGSFGDTYLAKDLDLPGHPHCVVKHLQPKHPDPDNPNPNLLPLAKRFFNTEAETLHKLGKLHKQIPSLSAHFEEKGQFYLVQDFIDGHDLKTELILGKKLSESYTITLLHDILEVLAIVHQQNVIHRDLKPANLMRRRQDDKIILIDFGAVKEITAMVVNAQGQTELTIAIGTRGYMPSEQASGKPRLSSDIHAVGMIGIQALTGQLPHTLPEDTQTGEVIWRNQAQVSNNLANVLDKMVRDHFSQRYQNADEALQAILSLSRPSPPPPSPPPPPRGSTVRVISTNTTRRTVLQLLGFGGLGLVGVVVSQSLLKNSSQTPTDQPSPPILPKDTPSPLPPPETPQPEPPTPKSPAPKVSSNPLKTVQFETVTVNSKGEITKRSQSQAQVFTETIANGITLEMMAIPGGRFVMGSPNTEAQRSNDEGPQRTVNVAPFFMGKYEVTQTQWRAVAGLPTVKIDLKANPSNFKGDDLPVEQVSWNDAIEFCARLSQLTGRNYRLPSEAEWEYACRAGTTTPFYFGETITTDLVNYEGSSPYGSAPKGTYREKTTAVGSFPPNSFGLYYMHGNVFEWCQDIWHDNYNGAPTDGSAWESGGDSKNRVLRGGSWLIDAVNCRAAYRGNHSPDNRGSYSFGFRVVCAAAWTS